MREYLRILHIEDSQDDADLVARFIRRAAGKVDITRVQTASEMERALKETEWDLVISDYSLPRFSGLEAIKILRASQPDTPIILVSGTIGEETAVEAVKLGATDYVLKSNLGRLPTSIERAMRESAELKEHRKTSEQLIQAQKMEAIGKLAGGIAHDVNNVLAATTLHAELTLYLLENNDQAGAIKNVRNILKAQESAAGIIRQLLMFSRRRSGPAHAIDFLEPVRSIQPLIKRLVGESIEVALDTTGEELAVVADSVQIEQIILNLAVNARDAMPSGGRLELTIERCSLDAPPPGALLPVKPGEFVMLKVKDTGCGIPADILPRIFEPFFTTKEVGKGTGLGLSVIYGILRQCGGSLAIESAVGVGTTFRIYWPSSAVAAPLPAADNTEPAPLASVQGLCAIVAEDEPGLRESIVSMLGSRGMIVLEAENGEEALRLMLDPKVKIDLLITDIVMPKMSGPTLVTKARQMRPGLPVLFLSGYADDTLDQYQIDPAATWFLEKPFPTKALWAKLAEAVAGLTPES